MKRPPLPLPRRRRATDAARGLEPRQRRVETQGAFGDPRVDRIELGSFKIIRLLGQGSFGSAYLAEQLNTDRSAVVKIAHPHLVNGVARDEVRKRFAAEVRTTTSVSHPNLVTIFTSGETRDGLPAIAMEYVDGETLSDLLIREAPLRGHMLAVFQQLASALRTVHDEGILHRDVAPKNVMVTQDNFGGVRAVLLDFGMAKAVHQSGSFRPVGTPHFVAPEQARFEPVPASDIYGLGALLWWAVCGSPMRTNADGRPTRSPRQLNQEVSPELEELLLKMVHVLPEVRPSAEDFMAVWPHFAAELDETHEAGHRASVLVVEPNETLRKMLGRVARRAGVRATLAQHPPDQIDHYDGVVVSSRLRSNQLLQLAQRARLLELPLLGTVHGGESRRSRSFTAVFAVPGELQALERHLGQLEPRPAPLDVDTLPPSSAPPSSTSFNRHQQTDRFVGEMPELLSVLAEAIANGDPLTLTGTLRRIEGAASQVGATSIERLARMYGALLETESLDPASASIADEIETAYVTYFRELIGPTSSTPNAGNPS